MDLQILNNRTHPPVFWTEGSACFPLETLTLMRDVADPSTGPKTPAELLERYLRDPIGHVSGTSIIVYNSALVSSVKKEGMSMGVRDSDPYVIEPDSQSAVAQLLRDYPTLHRAILELAQYAHQLWADAVREDWLIRVSAEDLDNQRTVVVAVPGTSDPESDAEKLWRLMAWRSTQDSEGVSSLPLVLTMEYSD